MPFVGCWWQIPISEPSAFTPACLSVARDWADELWCPVLFRNPLEPVCLQPPPLYTHAQTNRDTSSLILAARKQHLFSFRCLRVSYMQTIIGVWQSTRVHFNLNVQNGSKHSFLLFSWISVPFASRTSTRLVEKSALTRQLFGFWMSLLLLSESEWASARGLITQTSRPFTSLLFLWIPTFPLWLYCSACYSFFFHPIRCLVSHLYLTLHCSLVCPAYTNITLLHYVTLRYSFPFSFILHNTAL